ncbi:unnamed protein product, partial [marine sediment metagenome]
DQFTSPRLTNVKITIAQTEDNFAFPFLLQISSSQTMKPDYLYIGIVL